VRRCRRPHCGGVLVTVLDERRARRQEPELRCLLCGRSPEVRAWEPPEARDVDHRLLNAMERRSVDWQAE